MLLITGMLRSGTTLLEKLLAHHPRLSLLSQPFPFLFFEAKRAFLRGLGRTDLRYPLGDLFLETGYTSADFCRFLAAYQPARHELAASFDAMRGYSGQSTRLDPVLVADTLDRLPGSDFLETLDQLYRAFGQNKSAAWYGGKETLCEEYVPCVLARGGAGIVIVRDPRDMLASLDYGRGQAFSGARKPTLFNLRHWRRSVAFALHLERHACFAWLRYEDLVVRTMPELDRLAGMLGVPPFEPDAFARGIRGQDGAAWHGNSSHREHQALDDSSVGTHTRLLPPEVIAFTEAVCYPEMIRLGYRVSLPRTAVVETIETFRDDDGNVRDDLGPFFQDPRRTAEEVERLQRMTEPDTAGLYLFDDVRSILRGAWDAPSAVR